MIVSPPIPSLLRGAEASVSVEEIWWSCCWSATSRRSSRALVGLRRWSPAGAADAAHLGDAGHHQGRGSWLNDGARRGTRPKLDHLRDARRGMRSVTITSDLDACFWIASKMVSLVKQANRPVLRPAVRRRCA